MSKSTAADNPILSEQTIQKFTEVCGHKLTRNRPRLLHGVHTVHGVSERQTRVLHVTRSSTLGLYAGLPHLISV